MNVILTNRAKTYFARGTYNPFSKTLIVKVGAKVSADISDSPSFRGKKAIEKLRAQFVVDGITQEDVPFKSSSTAANFITGSSSNGMILWKTKDGMPLKNAISS